MIDHSNSKIRNLFLNMVVEAHRQNQGCKHYEFKIFQSSGDRISGKLENFDGRTLQFNVSNRSDPEGSYIPVVLFSEQVSTISLESSTLITKIAQAISVELDVDERFSNSVLCNEMLKPLMNKQNLSKPLAQRKVSNVFVSSLNTGSLKLVGNVLACDDEFLILQSERLSSGREGNGERMFHQLQLVNMNDVSTIETGYVEMKDSRPQRYPRTYA